MRPRRTPLLLVGSLLTVAVAGSVALAGPGAHDEVRDMSWPLPDVVAITDDYDDPRGGNNRGCENGRIHQAIDIMADKMTPIHAAMGGTVTWLPTDEPSYGWIIMVAGDDGLEYSYVHLNNDTPGTDDGAGGIEHAIVDGVRKGVRIERGQHIAWVGDSGSAESTPPHLHLDINDPEQEDPQLACPWRGDRVNPYPSMVAALLRGDVPGSIRPIGSSAVGDVEDAGDDVWVENPPVPDGWTFADVDPRGVHAAAVATLRDRGVLDGCTGTRYCPADPLLRRDMARFLTLALDLPRADPAFGDVPSDDPDAASIGAVVAAGIAQGTGDGAFSPDDSVTRGQMAQFLTTAFGLPGAVPEFTDVPPLGVFGDAIGALVRAGITEGCEDGRTFCPSEVVTRGQIASFLVRAD